MPRNPNKKKCQIPGCRNWAMRGHNHCRPHLDQFLGPRGAGAPENNVNAVKTAKNAAPFSTPQINQIALQITQNPDQIKQTLHDAIDSILRRTDDPFKILLLFQLLLVQLIPQVADNIFVDEIDAFLPRLPPEIRTTFLTNAWQGALSKDPATRLKLIRGLIDNTPPELLIDDSL